MNNILPARIGEFVRAHVGGSVMKHSRTHVLATIAGERLADGVVISLLFAVLFGVGASEVEREQGKNLFYVAYLFGLASLGTGFLLLKRDWVFRILDSIRSKMSGRLAQYILIPSQEIYRGLGTDVRTCSPFSNKPLVFSCLES